MQMKKLAAIFLALVMVLSVASLSAFADTTDAKPSITVIGNESVAPGSDITFDVKLENFSSVKGMDILITGDNGVVFKSITSADVTLTKDSNYTLSATKIKIVELNGKSALVLKVTATVPANADVTANISVSAKLAASATEFVGGATIKGGQLTTVAVTRAKGAQLRKRAETDPYALRFGLVASCTGAKYKDGYVVDYSNAKVSINGVSRDVVQIGAIVAVTAKATGKELVIEDITDGTKAYIKDVKAVKAYEVTNDTVSYVVAVTGISSDKADKELTIRPYVAYKDDAGKTQYTYGIALTRSVNAVIG